MLRVCLVLAVFSSCALDRRGLGGAAPEPAEAGTTVDASRADGGPRDAVAVDTGGGCAPRCEAQVAVTCPGGVEARTDCAALQMTCDPGAVACRCTAGAGTCSADGASVTVCDPGGASTSVLACARGCDPATSACRPQVACATTGLPMLATGTMRMDLCGTGDDHNGSCANSDGEDVVVRLEVDRPGHYVIDLRDVLDTRPVDSVVFVQTACRDADAVELGCADDISLTNLDAHLELDLAAGEYFIVVDSINGIGTDCGSVDLTVSRSP